MVERHVDRPELQPEKAGRAGEGRLDHPVELEEGLQLRLVKVVLGAAPLVRIVMPVPGLEPPVDAVFMHHRLEHHGIRLGPRPRRAQTRIRRSRTASGVFAISVSSL
jgi:hypothetical protein